MYDHVLNTAYKSYDTFDDIDVEINSIKKLESIVSEQLKGKFGVIITGNGGLSTPKNCYWGSAIKLPTGESIQIRISPRNCLKKPIGKHEVCFIAIRTTSDKNMPCTAFGIFYHPPLDIVSGDNNNASSNSTIGCRGVHMMMPSIFSKHDAQRNVKVQHTQLDSDGFHSVRPSTVCLKVSNTPETDFKFTTGNAYMVIAASMGGIHLPDRLRRSNSSKLERDHLNEIIQDQMYMKKRIKNNVSTYVASALQLCELISANGILGIMSNPFFDYTLPDMMYSPCGVPLCITMAVHVACHSERFNLPPCTKQDSFSNQIIMRAFKSRWGEIMFHDFRALDIAFKSGYDNALMEAEKENTTVLLIDNMQFWQKIGQRVVTKLASNPEDELLKFDDTHIKYFDKSELVEDEITKLKYKLLNKQGLCCSVKEGVFDNIELASRADIKNKLYQIQDTIEKWLRTGCFEDNQISSPNSTKSSFNCKECCSLQKCKSCKHKSEIKKAESIIDTSFGVDKHETTKQMDDNSILNDSVCIDAMETASGAISLAMLHGAFCMNHFDLKCFVFGDKCNNKCANCDEDVSVLQGTLFTTKSGKCNRCGRRRCYKCIACTINSETDSEKYCLRCVPK
jgi:hypothetical protein